MFGFVVNTAEISQRFFSFQSTLGLVYEMNNGILLSIA
jgi:hypothetical protein